MDKEWVKLPVACTFVLLLCDCLPGIGEQAHGQEPAGMVFDTTLYHPVVDTALFRHVVDDIRARQDSHPQYRFQIIPRPFSAHDEAPFADGSNVLPQASMFSQGREQVLSVLGVEVASLSEVTDPGHDERSTSYIMGLPYRGNPCGGMLRRTTDRAHRDCESPARIESIVAQRWTMRVIAIVGSALELIFDYVLAPGPGGEGWAIVDRQIVACCS